MLKFEKIIMVNGNKYDVEYDSSALILDLFENVKTANDRIILKLLYGTENYTIDLGKLISHHITISFSDIDHLINNLTPEMIYSFSTSLFHQHKVIRSFMSNDLPGDVVISPYNIEIDEMSNTTYDPSYKDIVISCDKYDLTKVIPVIGNKLRKCSWNNKKICLKDQVKLAREVDILTFLSFGEVGITLHNLRDIVNNENNITTNKSYILVLNGRMFYDIDYIFKIDRNKNKLILNDKFIMELMTDFETFDNVIDDIDSFLIELDVDNIYVRNVLMSQVDDNNGVGVFKYFEKFLNKNCVDYICIDNANETIHGLTLITDQYENVAIDGDMYEHHVYIHGGNANMRLVQLALY